jgi:hypothetical protein
MTMQKLASDLYDAFETRHRQNGDTFHSLREGSPEWMGEIVQEAHGDMFPDDWRYAAIRRVACAIADTGDDEDLDDAGAEKVDAMVDVYNGRLAEWLASHAMRAGYCDEAAQEYGADPKRGIIGLMQIGQYAEYSEIWGIVAVALERVAADLEN